MLIERSLYVLISVIMDIQIHYVHAYQNYEGELLPLSAYGEENGLMGSCSRERAKKM